MKHGRTPGCQREAQGPYIRRRSVDHVLRELAGVKALRPKLAGIAISDDIFAPPRRWLEEFCDR